MDITGVGYDSTVKNDINVKGAVEKLKLKRMMQDGRETDSRNTLIKKCESERSKKAAD